MTSIYKLALSGVRSFSDEGEEVVQFGVPLTLIVGQNGSGKTTIIESLRYATTGEVPPNTNKGVSFVNDPNLHSSNETNAHIKLAFKTLRGKQMILTKNMMVSKNNRTKGLSFKTKENQLKVIDRHGNKETMSSKVADIERLIPQYLGVNKAILENVIFCHQDDSLWPISDSATLKRKFDEIFDSVKFIDALNDMKDINKSLNSDIKELTIIVEHLLQDKKRYITKLDSIKDLETQIDELDDQMTSIEEYIQVDTKDLNNLHNSNQNFEQIINKFENLQQQKLSIEQNIDRIESTTEILNHSKESLVDQLNNFVNIVSNQRIESNSLKNEVADKIVILADLRTKQNDILIQAGQYKAAFEKHQLDLKTKNDLFDHYRNEIGGGNSAQFDVNLELKLNTLKENFKILDTKFNDQLEKLNIRIDGIKNDVTKENQHLIYIKQDIETSESRRIELKNRLTSISNNQSRLQTLRQELDEKQNEWENALLQNKIVELNKEISNTQLNTQNFELSLDICKENMKLSRNNSELLSKIDILKNLNKSSNRYLENSINIIKPYIDNLDGDFNEQYQQKLNLLTDENTQLKTQTDKLNSEISIINYNIENKSKVWSENESTRNQLEDKLSKLQESFKKVYCSPFHLENFDGELAKYESFFEEENRVFKYKEFLIDYYKNAITYAKSKKSCQLCHTQLLNADGDGGEDEIEDKEFFADFIKHLQHQQLKLENQNNDSGTLTLKRDILSKLRSAKHDYDNLIKLEENLKAAKGAVNHDRNQLKVYEKQLIDLKQASNTILNKINDWKLISEDVKSVTRIKNEIEERENEIKILQNTLSERGIEFNNEQLDLEFENLNNSIKSSRIMIDKLRMERDNIQKNKNDFINAINEMKLKINDLEMKSMDKVNIEKAISENEDQLSKLSESSKNIESKLHNLNSEFDQLNAKLIETKDVKSSELKLIDDEINKFELIKKSFYKVNESINEYLHVNGEKLYWESQEHMTTIGSEIEQFESKLKSLNKRLVEIDNRLNDTNNQERIIRFNIDYSDYQVQLQEIIEEIESVNVEQAKSSRSEYLIKSRELQQRQMLHQREMAGKLGEKTQLEKQIKFINIEVERDFKDIDKRHGNKFLELQTKLALSTDLATCYKATDDSILKYHQLQMFKINNIIDELWKGTYMGNDIESIKIKSDPIPVKNKSTTNTRNNRSYNYRVVMIKNGTELDMRGRCSAGQRVLASIIIRIALAECFGTNFGMITLDEPTTNLDEENIESLARALHMIIKDRMEQRNFQLIVITHDEKFLRMLNAVDFTDYYYKIQRNERLNSTINKVRINSIID